MKVGDGVGRKTVLMDHALTGYLDDCSPGGVVMMEEGIVIKVMKIACVEEGTYLMASLVVILVAILVVTVLIYMVSKVGTIHSDCAWPLCSCP